MIVDVVNRTKERIPAALLRRDAKSAGRILGKKTPDAVTIACVLPHESRRLKKAYLKTEKAANVLSFRYDAEHADIILTPVVIRHEARESGVPFTRLLRRLLVHGLVHIAGFAHERNRRDEKRFEKQEERIFLKLGISI